MVSWNYPYERLATESNQGQILQHGTFLTCAHWGKTEDELYAEQRSSIVNGLRSKELFDCKRGLSGTFIDEHDDPARALVAPVRQNSYNDRYYRGVCLQVTHKAPYSRE